MKRRKLKFAKPLSFGVMLKSAPAFTRNIPGFTKLAWPSSLLERMLGRRLPSVVSSTPEPVRRMASVPETEEAAGKIWQIHDGIEAAGAAIARVGIPGGIERGNAVANPIAIEGEFRGGHLRVHRNATPGDRIKSVLTGRLIKR